MAAFDKSKISTVNRKPSRANYDEQAVYSIIDESKVCHVAFIQDGKPIVIPTNFGRVDNIIYLHGAKASRLMGVIASGVDICIEMTLLDGLVLARSAFDHSVNYRSVVLFGAGELVEDNEEKLIALKAVSDQIVMGRWDMVRQPTEKELNATAVVAFTITEASAKSRTGGVIDEPEDYSLPIWAGVVPLEVKATAIESDDRLLPGVEIPNHVKDLLD